MLKALEARYGKVSIVVVVDSDGDKAKVHAEFRTNADWNRHRLIIADPDVQSWLPDAPTSGKKDSLYLYLATNRASLSSIERKHPEFTDFIEAIVA
jgi:dsDNA-binding SOS-regulon protein